MYTGKDFKPYWEIFIISVGKKEGYLCGMFLFPHTRDTYINVHRLDNRAQN